LKRVDEILETPAQIQGRGILDAIERVRLSKTTVIEILPATASLHAQERSIGRRGLLASRQADHAAPISPLSNPILRSFQKQLARTADSPGASGDRTQHDLRNDDAGDAELAVLSAIVGEIRRLLPAPWVGSGSTAVDPTAEYEWLGRVQGLFIATHQGDQVVPNEVMTGQTRH
jgi:hypothetical protein